MTAGQKELVIAQFAVLRQVMKKEGLVFGILVNPVDYEKSELAIIERDSLFAGGNKGISISLSDLNKGLL